MVPLDDAMLDNHLAAEPLPAPSSALLARASRHLGTPRQASQAARASWLDRLAEVTAQFQAALAGPQLALMTVATRGAVAEAQLLGADHAALAHTVDGNTIFGQVFVTALETPEGFEVELRRDDETIDSELTDATGRFDFGGLLPGEYDLVVGELELDQTVRIEA